MTDKEAIDLLTMIEVKEPNELIVNSWWGGFVKDYKEALQMAIKALEQTRWIPVSERLPEEYKRVIVSDVFGIYIGEFIDAEEKWGGKHFTNEHGMRSKSAKAWMPLPEPYKVESEDKE